MNKEEKKKLLILVGRTTLDKTDYDAIGLNDKEDVLSIGYINNSSASILLTWNKKELQVSFNAKITHIESYGWWFKVGEKIPCSVVIANDFK